MSAFIVDKDHIDALVTLAVRGPSGIEVNPSTAWRMGSFYNPITAQRIEVSHNAADRLGVILWAENVKSVQDRYSNEDEDSLPGPVPFSPADVLLYVWPFRGQRLSAVAGLKALDCYEHQSCEHDGWRGSDAYWFVQALRSALIGYLPGYDDAAWEIQSANA